MSEKKIEVKEVENFDSVVSYSEFLKEHAEKSARLIVQVYSKSQGIYVGHSFECNLLLFREEMARWNYKKIEAVNNDVARFPKEHGLVVVGYFDDNNRVVGCDRVFIPIYDMLSDSQKLDYEDFQKALQALASAREGSKK